MIDLEQLLAVTMTARYHPLCRWIMLCVFRRARRAICWKYSQSILATHGTASVTGIRSKSNSKVCAAKRNLIDCHAFGSHPIRRILSFVPTWPGCVVSSGPEYHSNNFDGSSWRAGQSNRP